MTERNTDPQTTQRFENLVVVRESAMYDHLLMEGMIDQTLEKARHVPGSEKMREAGTEPVQFPQRYNAHQIRRGRSKAVLIEQQGTLFLYSEGSAAKADDREGNNAFVEILIEVIETYRPRHLWVSVFSRLVRAAEHGGRLLATVSKYVDVVHAETDMDLSSDQGRMSWQMYTMLADAERNSIVNRLIIGRIFWWRRGQWILPSAVPLGYHLVDGEIKLKPDEIGVTKAMLRLLADPTLTAPQVCASLGQMGASSSQLRAIHGEDATFADARNSYSAVVALRNWLDLYRTGTYRYRESIPIRVSDRIGGVPVQRGRDGTPFIELILEAPLPEGGWASDEVFEMAKGRPTRSHQNQGGKARRVSKPFVNHFQHDDGTYEYSVRSRRGRYLLYRRPSGDPSRSWYKGGNKIDAELIGSIAAGTLHASIATNVAEAIRDGVPAELFGEELFWSEGERRLPRIQSRQQLIDGVRRRLADTERLEAQARRRAIEADDDLAAAFIEDARGLRTEARQLNERLIELESEAAIATELEDEWQSNATAIAAALGKLACVEDTATAHLRSAIDTIFTDSTLRPCGEGLAEWTSFVLVPADDGAVKLGPISGRVALLSKRGKRADKSGLSPKSRTILKQHPDAEISDKLRPIVSGEKPPEDPFTAYLAETYSGKMNTWPRRRWRLDDCGRQDLIDALARLGGEASPQQLIDEGVDRNHIHRFSKPSTGPVDHPVADRIGAWKKGPAPQGRALRLKGCPHCGGFLSVVLRVPEVPGGLLCPSCRRSAVSDSPVYPDCYFSVSVSLAA